MTIAIAAAGTGGHVLPALAVAEAVGEAAEVFFVGGTRFEAQAVPSAGYELVTVPLRGLQRRFTFENLLIPFALFSAVSTLKQEFQRRGVRVVFATGGYVTVPAALAANRLGIPYFLAEQNAHVGLANRLMAKKARAVFTSFPVTSGLERPRFVGNPVRKQLTGFSRRLAHREAFDRYGLQPNRLTLGVVGGSLGSGPINEAVLSAATMWDKDEVQIVHLAGSRFEDEVTEDSEASDLNWKVVGFEDRMDLFYGAVDLVISRSGGIVAELTVTGTPSILVPGSHGSSGHQIASAQYLESSGAAIVLEEDGLAAALGQTVADLLVNKKLLSEMARAALALAKPNAANDIAEVLLKCF